MYLPGTPQCDIFDFLSSLIIFATSSGDVFMLLTSVMFSSLSRVGISSSSTEGQYSGKMLAETGSFDILFGNWVLGIGFFHLYLSIYIYKYILGVYTCMYIYMYIYD